MRWCPAPGCIYLAKNSSLMKIEIKCKCGHLFCFGCGAESHSPASCEVIKKWDLKNSAESENLSWIMANTKPCPKCSRSIEKNQGCNHMTCT